MENTGSAHFYEAKVLEIIARLQLETTDESLVLLREGERLIDLFRAWLTSPPSYDDRIAAMKSLFDLNRGMLEYLEKHTQEGQQAKAGGGGGELEETPAGAAQKPGVVTGDT